jgi:hypothetical protein
MKKSLKKLTLSKETLMRLDREKLGEIVGGYIRDTSAEGGCVLSANICSNKETCATCVEQTQ